MAERNRTGQGRSGRSTWHVVGGERKCEATCEWGQPKDGAGGVHGWAEKAWRPILDREIGRPIDRELKDLYIPTVRGHAPTIPNWENGRGWIRAAAAGSNSGRRPTEYMYRWQSRPVKRVEGDELKRHGSRGAGTRLAPSRRSAGAGGWERGGEWKRSLRMGRERIPGLGQTSPMYESAIERRIHCYIYDSPKYRPELNSIDYGFFRASRAR